MVGFPLSDFIQCFGLAHMAGRDFKIGDLATYLHLTPQQVCRLADRGKLPGRKVSGEWRFSRQEIHHWLEERIGLSDEDELLNVEGVLDGSIGPDDDEVVRIAEMLPAEAIAVPFSPRTRNAVFRDIVDLAAGTGWLWDPGKMAEAVRSREDMSSTTLENGVALLHPRRPMPNILGQAFLALGCSTGGIPFGGDRGSLTDIFFLICSVNDRGHLRTLARLSRVIGAPGFLDRLRECPNAKSARRLVSKTETELPG